MFFYISVLMYTYIIIICLRKYPVVVIFFSTIPIILFSTFRGSSGKDSELYLFRFFSMKNNWDELGLFDEPILNILIYLSKHVLHGTHEIFFLFHASLTCLLFSFIVKRYNIARVYLLTVGPMFLIDGVTNGMRITLAYHFFIVAVLYRKHVIGGVFVILSHVTGLLMYGFKFVIDSNRISILKKIFIFFILLILIYVTSLYLERFLVYMPRIASKLDKYSIMILPTKYSGVVDIFIIMVVLSLSFWCRVESRVGLIFGFVFSVVLGATFYFMVQHSLGFIRVGKLFIVALFLSDFVTKSEKKIPFFILILLGGIYSLNFLRQVIFGYGFLPYPGIGY